MPRGVLRRFGALALALGLASAIDRAQASSQAAQAVGREAAWRENNLGVALLEQFRFAEAVPVFRRALAADPSLLAAQVNLAIAYFYVPDLDAAKRAALEAYEASPPAPQPHYLLALIARSEGQAEQALPHLRQVLDADPNDLGANVTLGQVYLQLRRFEEAAAAFRVALAAEPYNVSAAYNLAVALNRADRREEGQQAMARFQQLRDSPYKTALSANYLEQGRYAEAVASTGAESVDPKTPDVSFVQKQDQALPGASAVAAQAALVLADLDGDFALEAVVASGGSLRVLKGGSGPFVDVTEATGLAVKEALAAVAADSDNDGLADLLVTRRSGLSLFRNAGGSRFEDQSGAAGLGPVAAPTAAAAFVDVDHDGDLDAFAAGRLLQNNGNGTFSDITKPAGLEAAGAALAVIPTDFDNRRDVDLLVVSSEQARLFRNMRDGSFRDVAGELGLAKAPGPLRFAAKADANKDGYEDFLLGGAAAASLALSDGRGGFALRPLPEAAGAVAAQLVDYDNDGLLDVLVVSAKGLRLLRNLGASWADLSAAVFPEELRTASFEGAALGIADFDKDGDADAMVATPGRLRVLENRGGNRNRSYALRLRGRVSNRDGVGAKVEIRAGSLRQKLETSASVPMAAPADVAFGLGAREAPDAVRVIWVSGIVQTEVANEVASAAGGAASAGRVELVELDRKPSSCPYLYTWNGERFEFVTDFLGGGEMGYRVAPGVVSHPDPVEHVRIAPGQLAPRDGRYELRVTNELEEVLYLDRLRLVAIDHPEDVLVFPDEGMTTPPKPERLVAARDPRAPRAFDHRGREVTERLRGLDRVHVDELPSERIRGYAKPHALSFDLSGLPASHTLLLLTGWTDYAFSSDNVAAHQAGLALLPPRLEVERADGSWAVAVEQIGVPVGRPQTIVVDLAPHLGPSRRVRVVTSMRVMWDQARAVAPAGVALRPVALEPIRADLRERGFSAEASPDRREPWIFDYASTSWLAPWKTLPGRYTREGDVRRLVGASDDRFVVSKPGDELSLAFDALSLPPLRRGIARTFLLYGDGYSKERDINSASPDAVLPLPFRAMKSYPYRETDVPPEARRAFEDTASTRTRVVVRPITPIELHASKQQGTRAHE